MRLFRYYVWEGGVKEDIPCCCFAFRGKDISMTGGDPGFLSYALIVSYFIRLSY